MNAQELLQEIADYCRHSGLAESTFGRRAVNDGKLTARLRNGGRPTRGQQSREDQGSHAARISHATERMTDPSGTGRLLQTLI